MHTGWNKGLTKETNPSVRKISDTMKRKKIDNFAAWRDRMRRDGKFPSYNNLIKSGDLAELIGVVLGDGHIWKFPRAEELSIFSNSNNPGFVKRYSLLVEEIFGKKPTTTIHSGKNCIRIRIYQNHISSRLGVPLSPRRNKIIEVPKWILGNRGYIVRYLRGLYEAEGSHSVHLPTSTYKLFFSNRNRSLLKNVFSLMQQLGFHPHQSESNYAIQISRKDEVLTALKMLKFRVY
ncbi:MAG: hypothetical protein A3C06_03925 [Candidatus Taylorbacteria bacterium RIFCSPHIGHO2_02_FULL_46_13]|uniref:DOD-type homing endonuclease domain-containing protein n=1 Tax=Candidatus Taylorbacteria bacterium RIFCSPHIGHO2_02_FULL_46_13 TaxID=1802312 RepID=A0A1G2MQJ6_9BACT|nr:MAG: hypothetical protein A3C06_03925 [Candidatus Taylorbacteria bacterium RIFCSPHIGHO2_02_FULL_46_13]